MSHHAHDLFDLVASRPDGWVSADLTAAVAQQFGEDARFHTCSMSNLSLAELLEFAVPRGKLSLVGDRLVAGVHTCSH